MRRLAVVVAVVVVTLVRPLPAQADPAVPPSSVSYRPPVDAPVVDPYRPPPQPWEAGNRGIDYGTIPGTPVVAAADGEVVFAGQVGGTLHVVVLHADGIRTSYSFLRSISVARGDRVRQGDAVGTAGDDLHFGARVGDEYIDPAQLFDDGPPRVYLVPDEERRPGSEAKERSGVANLLAGIKRVASAPLSALSWARAGGAAALRNVTDAASKSVDGLQVAVRLAQQANPATRALRVLRTTADWYDQRGNCTPASTPVPRPGAGHLAVRVGGFDSSSGKAEIDKLDTNALGYAKDAVVRFSYRGGAVQDGPAGSYDGADTSGDLRTSAFRLRQLLERLGREHPNVPIDILAHSQGGLVARQALAHETDNGDRALPPINALVLLGTPNQGADLATVARMLDRSGLGQAGETAADALRPDRAKVQSTAVQQLAEGSDFLTKLNATPLPPGVKVTSIGARADLIVPSARTHLDGARNVVVTVPGTYDEHSLLPGSPAARREVALALAGRPPTCRSLGDMLLDGAISDAITTNEDALGLGASLVGGPLAPLPQLPLPRSVPSPPKEP